MKTTFKNYFIAVNPETGEMELESINEYEQFAQLWVSKYYDKGWSVMYVRGWRIAEIDLKITQSKNTPK